MSDQLTSPVGTILFMGIDKLYHDKYSGRDQYSIRLLFDGTTTEGAAFKETVTAVNEAKVVTISKTTDIPTGHYIVSAWSKFVPKVLDAEGTVVEEIPHFTRGSTGQAIMTCKTFEGAKGKGLNLTGVVILDLDLAEAVDTEGDVTVALRDAVKSIKRG